MAPSVHENFKFLLFIAIGFLNLENALFASKQVIIEKILKKPFSPESVSIKPSVNCFWNSFPQSFQLSFSGSNKL